MFRADKEDSRYAGLYGEIGERNSSHWSACQIWECRFQDLVWKDEKRGCFFLWNHWNSSYYWNFQNSESYVKSILPEDKHEATVELIPYLIDSFGNSTRIDYGTGHELNFLLFLIALFKIGVLTKSDEISIVLKVKNLIHL